MPPDEFDENADDVSDIAELVENEIEQAHERAEQNAEIAAVIADAAVAQAHRSEIDDLKQEILECRNTMETLPALLALKVSQTMETLRAELQAELMAAVVALLQSAGADAQRDPPLTDLPAPSASTPLISTDTLETVAVVTEQEPEKSHALKRKHRFL
jgi:hypothetical protein